MRKKNWKPVNLCDNVSQRPSRVSCSTIKKSITNHSFYNQEVLQYNKTDRKNTLHKSSAFGFSVLNPKPKLSQRVNQMKEEIPFRADEIQSKNKQTAPSAGQRVRQSRDWL